MNKLNNKGFTPLVVMVIVVAIAVVGYFVLHKSRVAITPTPSGYFMVLPTPSTSSRQAPTLKASKLPSPTPNETANLRVYQYRESNLEFSFKYPTDWYVNADSKGNLTLYKIRSDLATYIYLNIEDNPKNLALDQWIKSKEIANLGTTEVLNINGSSAIRASTGGTIGTKHVFVAMGDKVIHFFTEQRSTSINVFGNITNSFKTGK